MVIEGGPFNCLKHNFTVEWEEFDKTKENDQEYLKEYERKQLEHIRAVDEHCFKYNDFHTLSTIKICPVCKIEYRKTVPYIKGYQEDTSRLKLQCEKCGGWI
jgi:hypothetical protein